MTRAEQDDDEAPSPGNLLNTWLTEHEMPQVEMAARLGISPKHLNQIIKGHIGLGPDLACRLELVTGVWSMTWVTVDARWRTAQAQAADWRMLEANAGWMERFPLGWLAAQAILLNTEVSGDSLWRLLVFLGVANPVAADNVWQTQRRTHTHDGEVAADEHALRVWLRAGERHIRHTLVGAHDPAALTSLAASLREEPTPDPWVLAGRCAMAGVSLAIIPTPPGVGCVSALGWRAGRIMLLAAEQADHQALAQVVGAALAQVAHLGKRSTLLATTPGIMRP